MSAWARNRKILLIVIGLSLFVATAALIAVPFLYKTPTCSDGKQNQGETGIDCGGGCLRVCVAEATPPSVRFVRPIAQVGRTDVLAYIDNRNQNAAARNVKYVVELYDSSRTLVGKKEGTISLAPGLTTPLFVAGIPTGSREAVQAFVLFNNEEIEWEKYEQRVSVPVVKSAEFQEGGLPRIVATVENQTVRPFLNTALVVTVYDQSNTVIAASRTVVAEIGAGREVQAVFTWPSPFAVTPARIEVLPVPVP